MPTDPILTNSDLACPCCDSFNIDVFHEIKRVPVNTVMNNYSRAAALSFPCGDIALGFCGRCGFIFNTLFDPNAVRYSPHCEETQGCSPTFSAFAKDVALQLVEKYRIQNKTIIEIGCGKGEFLKYICALGGNKGVGFDPAYAPGRSDRKGTDSDVRFIRDFFSEKYSNFSGDLVCCIMTLEHVPDPVKLVRAVRHAVSNRREAVVFFQVPDVTRILKDCCFEDIYYEHCSYFSPATLSRLFGRSGFKHLSLQTVYGNQYILLEARAAEDDRPDRHDAIEKIDLLSRLIDEFKTRYPQVLRYWRNLLRQFREGSKKVVLWGGRVEGGRISQCCEGLRADTLCRRYQPASAGNIHGCNRTTHCGTLFPPNLSTGHRYRYECDLS